MQRDLYYTYSMHRLLSHALLALQIISFLFIVVTAPFFSGDVGLLFAQLFSLGFAGWGAYELFSKSKLTAFPEVHKDAKLLTHGPFEYVRHPIYSGIILFSLVSTISYFGFFRVAAFVILAIVIVFKLHLEEEYLTRHFPEYEHYQRKTKKLIPFLY